MQNENCPKIGLELNPRSLEGPQYKPPIWTTFNDQISYK